MVFDLSNTNKLQLSSTSSCTDYFFDGCHSKDLNKCEYRNCKCRSCCINSIINDHTYTLLKKICRKVMRDYQRQQSRQIYTIFNGGNSINVRIHRSSIVPTGDGKSKAREPKQKDSKKKESFAERNRAFRRKNINDADTYDNDAGSKRIDGTQKRRKNDLAELERGSRNKERDTEDVAGRQRKAKVNRDNVDDGGTDEYAGGPKTKGIRHVGEADVQGDFSRHKIRKGKKIEHANKDKNGDIEDNKKAVIRKRENDLDSEGRQPIDARKAKVKKDNVDDGGTDEYDGGPKTKGVRHVGEADVQGDFSRHKIRKGKKIEHANKDNNGDTEDNKKAVIRKRENGLDSEGRKPIDAVGKTDKKGQDKDRQRIIMENGNAEHRKNKNKPGDNEIMGTLKLERSKKTKYEREGSTKDNSGFRDVRLEDAAKPKSDRYTGSHLEGRSSQPKYKKGVDKAGRTMLNRKRKDLYNLPVISDLRAKVRRRHDIVAVQSHRKRKYGSSFSNEGRKRYIPSIQRQISKTTKDAHGSRSRFRASRGIGINFVRYQEYRTSMLSRSDEVRPCDILRAHMEQRELCERQRYYCLPCPCSCSAVYCQAPSTTCSPSY